MVKFITNPLHAVKKVNYLVLLTASLLAWGTTKTWAQANVVKLNVAPLLALSESRVLSLSYERRIAPTRSLQTTLDYSRLTYLEFRTRWLGLTADYRFYGLVPALRGGTEDRVTGFFVAPTLGIRRITAVDLEDPDPLYDEKYTAMQAGGHVGYQWLLGKSGANSKFSVDASVGLLGNFMLKGEALFYDDYRIWPSFRTGLTPVANLSIGFAFGR